MTETEDIKFMHRCLELASGAEGLTYPNPMVGAVIVYEGKILGEGYHVRSGEPHAEVIAIKSVSDTSKLSLSTLYVNLEPCSHFGRTPPCADYIISNKIPRIVIGSTDTSDKVSGKGIKRLLEAGCEVKAGVIEEECRRLNRRFFAFHERKRPYITLKWAQSDDGYLDIIRSEEQKSGPTWISGKPERVLVHKWRAAEQAILIGGKTLKADEPQLNVREWKGSDPLRLILSGTGSVSIDSLKQNSKAGVIVFTHNASADIPDKNRVILDKSVPSSEQIVRYLYSSGIQSLFIEGGAEVLNHFISTSLWDEARIFKGKGYFRKGVKAPSISGILSSRTVFSGSSLEIYLKNGS